MRCQTHFNLGYGVPYKTSAYFDFSLWKHMVSPLEVKLNQADDSIIKTNTHSIFLWLFLLTDFKTKLLQTTNIFLFNTSIGNQRLLDVYS